MDLDALKAEYIRVFRFISHERNMRTKVFKIGDPRRADKLAECDQALESLIKIKDAAKIQIARQADLFDDAGGGSPSGGSGEGYYREGVSNGS